MLTKPWFEYIISLLNQVVLIVNMQNKNQWIDNFVLDIIDGWMVKDLESLLTNIPQQINESGNCNFPITLYVFSCIEFLGQLTNATPVNTNVSGYTQNAISNYIDNFFPDEFKRKLQPYQNSFINIFRNGLAHNYFAKSAGISRGETTPIQVDKNGCLILDADIFATSFIDSIEKLKSVINTDASLAKRITDRYADQYQTNKLKFQFTPTKTFVSGASLPHPDSLKKLTTTMPPEDWAGRPI